MRRLLLKSTYNMRDLGGYPTQDGKVTKFGRIFRSDCPTPFNEADLEILGEKGITLAIDLRISEEIDKRPSGFATLAGVEYHNCRFALGDRSPESEEEIPHLYMELFEDFFNIKRVVELIAHSKGTAVYHCAVGKDRTGVISAVLLGICGVHNEDIMADYQISYTYLKHLVNQLKARYPEWPHWMGRSEMEYMEGALELLMKKYGTWEDYFKAVGFTEGVLGQIRKKLLE